MLVKNRPVADKKPVPDRFSVSRITTESLIECDALISELSPIQFDTLKSDVFENTFSVPLIATEDENVSDALNVSDPENAMLGRNTSLSVKGLVGHNCIT
jgi:hypothetical protein